MQNYMSEDYAESASDFPLSGLLIQEFSTVFMETTRFKLKRPSIFSNIMLLNVHFALLWSTTPLFQLFLPQCKDNLEFMLNRVQL